MNDKNSNHIIGRNPVLELLKSDTQIDKLYVQKSESKGSIIKIINQAKEKNIIIQYVEKEKLDYLSNGLAHQGVIAVVNDYTYSDISEIIDYAKEINQDPFVVILDGIEDPHNLGAIIRTAECAGVHGIIIPKRRAATVNETVIKTSAGAAIHMKIAKVTNISTAIEELKELGLWIYGADMDGESLYYKTSLRGPIGLVIGSEGKGISRLVKEKCDGLLKIPIKGKIGSLNASAAAAILIYEVERQRNGN
ncbi:MAG: 23S rRNA (guanosine(2251)-2'-O)-methyltransferase RlmB [Tissierellales bacterium]|nr:23S rRNA (guanosine(2251)-2'-O)-methyltransferase RlmB [Tissierellales bacterium]